MSIVEKQIVAQASPAVIFSIYRDVENWRRWDPDTESARLNEGLVLGAKGQLKPSKGQTVPMEITAIAEDRHFTATSKTVLFRLDFEHRLEPAEGGTRIVHRVRFSGLLKPLLARILGPQLERGLPITLQNLKSLAESMQANGV